MEEELWQRSVTPSLINLIARTVEAHGDLPDIGWRKLEPSNGLGLWRERVIVDCTDWCVLEF